MSKDDARLILYKNLLFGDLKDKGVQSIINQCVDCLNK